MSAHPIGSATISFGLVSVPIKLFSAGEPTTAVSFNWLHKTDGSRLKQQYFCPKDGEVVDKDGMIKGYEFSKGQYVQFTAEELPRPFIKLGLGDPLVGLGDPDPLADLEKVGDGLEHDDVGERGVLIQDVHGLGLRGDPQDRASPRGDDRPQRVRKVQKYAIADNLGEEVGPGRARRMALALDVQGREPNELVVGEDPLPGLVECEAG